MSEIGIIILLYFLGVLILMAEIFIPSHGVLSVVGLGFLVSAVVKTFSYGGREAGVVAVLGCMVFLPIFAYTAIKYWPRTPIGKRISPPNPKLTTFDVGVPIDQLNALVGKTGRTLSPLRPVGVCDFDGRRITCVADLGAVEPDVAVVGTGVRNGNLAVAVKVG